MGFLYFFHLPYISHHMTSSKPFFVFNLRNLKPSLNMRILLLSNVTLWSWQSFKDLGFLTYCNQGTRWDSYSGQGNQIVNWMAGDDQILIEYPCILVEINAWISSRDLKFHLSNIVHFFKRRNSKCISIWVQSITILLWNFRNLLR